MGKKHWLATAGLGCVVLVLLVAVVAIPLVVVPLQIRMALRSDAYRQLTPAEQQVPQPVAIPTLPAATAVQPSRALPGGEPATLAALYAQVNPGVVNIKVYIRRGLRSGQGAGSGFILDDKGHIVTNNHVIDQADVVTVIFYNGIEAEATIVGTDPDSDLAVIRVDGLPEGTHPLPLGDSDRVVVGETVIAIGNPFGLGSSMTAGIVSAVGRTIPSGATYFDIPHAIQTDAAINPGNSGGPLLNLKGEVVGVNAQIASGGTPANAGVGFAIPANIVRRVAPVLIEKGSFEWPWLGVMGGAVNLAIMRANGLDTQHGAYIHEVVPGSPADGAGLRGSSGVKEVDGQRVFVGGDVVVEADGEAITDFDSLLVAVASKSPGDRIELTILRNGRRRQVTVKLATRPRS